MIQTIRHIQTKDGADITARLVLNGSRLGRYSFNPHYTHKEDAPKIEFFDPNYTSTALGAYITEYHVKDLEQMRAYSDVTLVQGFYTLSNRTVIDLLLWADSQVSQIH